MLYNFFVSIYKNQISFAEATLSTYQFAEAINKYNFQIIQNARNLRFNIRGIPLRNSVDLTKNIKSLASFLTDNQNFLLIDVKSYYDNRKIKKTRIRTSSKKMSPNFHLYKKKSNEEINNKESNKEVDKLEIKISD